VEFIESLPFTRRLQQLGDRAAGELLNAIQRELLEKPDRGSMVPGLGGVRKARRVPLSVSVPGEKTAHSPADFARQERTGRRQQRATRTDEGLDRADQKRHGRVTMAKKIKVNIFDDMREALRDVAAYERGEAVNLRVTRIPSRPKEISPREIRRIREALQASQPLFAAYLNVSTNAVRSWEQGTRRPRQAALKLLAIARKNPKALLVA